MRADIFDPGRMTARLDLERPADAPDGQGGAVRSYATAGALWALIEPRGVLAGEAGDEAVRDVTHDVWIRHRDDIGAGMRLRKGTRIFDIRAVFDPDETRRYLVCRCREAGR